MRFRISDGDTSAEPASEAGRSETRRSPARVLIVEDDDDVNAAMCAVLSDEGYDILSARNGAEALNLLRAATPPDVILLDLMMPVMDGWEFRAAQKAEPRLASIPVIALSANVTPQARAIDAAEFLSKPVEGNVLRAAVERVFARSMASRVANAERMAALGALAAGVAHEINNPLTYMLANLTSLLGRLRDGPLRPTPDALEMLEDTLHGAERIARIVRSVQSVTPPRASDRPGPVDVQAAVEGSLRVVANELRHRARVVKTFTRLPPVRAFPGQLEQVFINLLLNAAHAIEEGKAHENRVEVATRVGPGGAVIIRVADTGCGIAAPIRARVFEPFFTTKARGAGTGLGLSICQGIVRSLGGTITFSAREGGGTVFEVAVPSMQSTSIGPPSRTNDVSPSRRMRVLAVDDEEPVLRAIRLMLEPDHEVLVASSGPEALTLIDRNLDVVLCDLAMPEMTAADLLHALEGRSPELARRAILMTAGAFTPAARALAESGKHVVLPKPLSREALRAAVELAGPGS